MDKAQFWRLIENAKKGSGGDCEEQVQRLQHRLERLPAEEIISFNEIYDEFRDSAYRWDLWGAAYIINGGCSDDGFEYFRGWLIAQGEAVYRNAVSDPDSLANVAADFEDAECESMLYVATMAYEAKTGHEMPYGTRAQASIIGEQWQDNDELDARFPKLAAKIASQSSPESP